MSPFAASILVSTPSTAFLISEGFVALFTAVLASSIALVAASYEVLTLACCSEVNALYAASSSAFLVSSFAIPAFLAFCSLLVFCSLAASRAFLISSAVASCFARAASKAVSVGSLAGVPPSNSLRAASSVWFGSDESSFPPLPWSRNTNVAFCASSLTPLSSLSFLASSTTLFTPLMSAALLTLPLRVFFSSSLKLGSLLIISLAASLAASSFCWFSASVPF